MKEERKREEKRREKKRRREAAGREYRPTKWSSLFAIVLARAGF